MKILLLVPVHRQYYTKNVKKIYGIPESQGQASWVRALLKLGHNLSVFKYTDSMIIPNVVQASLLSFFEKHFPIFTGRVRRKLESIYRYNPETLLKSRRFENIAKSFKPDIIIISGGITSLHTSSIKRIKDIFRTKVFLFSGVNPKTSSTQLEKDLIASGIIDLVVENDTGYAENWKKLGVKTRVLPISSVDPRKHRKIKLTKNEQDEYKCEVCFVGSLTSDRIKKLDYFKKFTFKFWGDIKPGVKIPPDLRTFYMGNAHGKKMIKIFNSAKIVLNFQPPDMTAGGNMRTFEIPGSGAFQLADKVDNLFFTDRKEIVLFSDMKNAVLKTKFYLEHEKERRNIKEKGFLRAHKDHTYAKHFKKLLS